MFSTFNAKSALVPLSSCLISPLDQLALRHRLGILHRPFRSDVAANSDPLLLNLRQLQAFHQSCHTIHNRPTRMATELYHVIPIGEMASTIRVRLQPGEYDLDTNGRLGCGLGSLCKQRRRIGRGEERCETKRNGIIAARPRVA